MTLADFNRIVNNATVRLVADRGDGGGLFVQGVTQAELAELVTLAGRQLGAMPDEMAAINPEWLAAELGYSLHQPGTVEMGPPPTTKLPRSGVSSAAITAWADKLMANTEAVAAPSPTPDSC